MPPIVDGLTVALLAAATGAIAAIAMLVPARRALAVDPVAALRGE